MQDFLAHVDGLDASSLSLQISLDIRAAHSQVEFLQDLQEHSEKLAGRFEWMDGLLIRALERGDWLLIDNVNFCNPTVLDRLNALLENHGSLMVNERGLVDGEIKIIRPHPDFRIFMTMDPSN